MNIDDIAFLQINDPVRGAGQRQRIGRQKIFMVANTDHQRRPLPGTDHPLRFVTANDRNGKRAPQADNGCLHRFQQIPLIEAVDQMCDDLRVGLAGKNIPLHFQRFAQLGMIFDNTVMHQRNPLAGKMGMGIVRGWRAMCRPAGMRNTEKSRKMMSVDLFFQFGHP